MVTRVERRAELPAPPEEVWAFIADPAKRAEAISVVDHYDMEDGETVWHVRLPVISTTVPVRTEEVERDEPRYVKFVGNSRAFHVEGEHELEPHNGGTLLTIRFVVQGRLPGVERFFKSRLEDELDNLEAALRAELKA